MQDVLLFVRDHARNNKCDVSAHVCEVSTMNNCTALSLKTIIHDKKNFKILCLD